MSIRTATMEQLETFIGEDDLDATEIKFICKYLTDDSLTTSQVSKLERAMLTSAKALDKIPTALQIAMITVSEKAVAAIGELLHPTAQQLVCAEYKDDIQTLVKHATDYKVIDECLWKVLAKAARAEELPTSKIKKLIARKDCPPQFAKACGIDVVVAEKTKRKANPVDSHTPRKTVKSKIHDDEDDEDYEFADSKRAVSSARTVKRPRS